MDVYVTPCEEEVELFRQYDITDDPQPCFIALDIQDGQLWADYDSAVDGGGIPARVWHGIARRYPIPILTGTAANRVMDVLRPLAQRVVADSEIIWDGSNHIARLGDDADTAEEKIQELLSFDGLTPGEFAEEDLVMVWPLDASTTGEEIEQYGITAGTSDSRLAEIKREILTELSACTHSPVSIAPDLYDYLVEVRDDLAG